MKAEDERIKQILVGLEIKTIYDLDAVADELRLPRSQIIREAIDLWFKAYHLKKGVKQPDGGK